MQESDRLFSRRRIALKVAAAVFCLALLRVLWFHFGVPGIMLGSVGIMVGLGAIMFGKGVLTFHRTVKSYRPTPADGQAEEATKRKSRLISQFLSASLLYLAVVCPILSVLTDCHIFLVFLAVMAGVVFTGTVILVWITSWAMRKDSRGNQFSILTLLFLTLLVATYLGAIRWLADLAGDELGAGEHTFLAAAAICVILTLISLPFMVLIMESLVWFAAWLVRRPWVQQWIRR